MAKSEFTLIDGLPFGEGDKEVIHKKVILRTLTAGDLEDAAEESEKVIRDGDDLAIVTSPVLMSNQILRRQILQIGDIMGPVPAVMLRKLSSVDLELLQAEAELLDSAGRLAVGAALLRGRPEEPATAD